MFILFKNYIHIRLKINIYKVFTDFILKEDLLYWLYMLTISNKIKTYLGSQDEAMLLK